MKRVTSRAFNNGYVKISMLQLTPEIEKLLKGLSRRVSTMVKGFLCTYADNKGGFGKEPVVLCPCVDNLALLPTILESLSLMDLFGFSAYKKDFLYLLPSFAYDLRQITSIAREFPQILKGMDSTKIPDFINLMAVLVGFDSPNIGPLLCVNGEKTVAYLKIIAEEPTHSGGVKFIEAYLADYGDDPVSKERAACMQKRLLKSEIREIRKFIRPY